MKDLVTIATQVRKQCEIFSSSPSAKGYDFHRYSGVTNNLACMCAVASYTLAKELNDNGIRCKMVRGKFSREGIYNEYCDHHCWVETHNQIIDITATQFGIKKPVFIVSRHHKKYLKGAIIRTPAEMKDWGNQKPNPKLTKKILAIPVKGDNNGY